MKTIVTTTPVPPVAHLFVQLGKAMLQKTSHTDWLDVQPLAQKCKHHKIQLNGTNPTNDELEAALKEYFSTTGELYHDGICAEGFNRRVGCHLVFMVRLDRYHQNYSSATKNQSNVKGLAPGHAFAA